MKQYSINVVLLEMNYDIFYKTNSRSIKNYYMEGSGGATIK